MKNRSNLPEDDKIGCAIIKKMRKDVADLKKNEFFIPRYARWTCFLGLVIAIGFCVRSFWPSRISERIVYEIKVDKANNADGKIDEVAIKKELAEALVAVEARAANAYNDKFVALLTVLTVFGIAWPVIMGILQFKFSEKEINKIESALEEIKSLEERAQEINLAIAMSHEAAVLLFVNAYNNASNVGEKLRSVFGIITSFDHDLNCRARNQEKAEIINIITYVLNVLATADPKLLSSVKSTIAKNAKPDNRFVSGKEIKDILGAENIELYRKYREFFIELYPLKFKDDGE